MSSCAVYIHEALLWWGPIVSAYVPAGALVFAVLRGSREWTRWKREHRVTKHAEVAAQVLGASMRFADGLSANASIWFTSREKPPEERVTTEREQTRNEGALLEAQLSARWDAFQPSKAAFVEAMDLAEIYLAEPINVLLNELWRAQAGLYASQTTYVMTLKQGTHMEKLFEGALGSDAQNKFADIRGKVRAALRPLAQMQD